MKNEGLVLHGKARAVQLIDNLLHGRNESIMKIQQEFADNLISEKLFL